MNSGNDYAGKFVEPLLDLEMPLADWAAGFAPINGFAGVFNGRLYP